MTDKHRDEAIELLVSIPLVINRKLHRQILMATIEQSGENLAPHHVIIMKMLQGDEPINMSGIGDEIGISRSQMTHSIDRLISLGLIERQQDLRDRRKINIKLTTKGKEIIEKLQLILKSRMKAKLSSLSDDDLQRLVTSLRNLADILLKEH